jgi:peptide/nickel transport system substrate-binding protein
VRAVKILKSAAVVATAVLALGSLAACGGGDDGGGGSGSAGGVLTYSMPTDITTLDTSESGGTSSNAIKNMIYEGLTKLKPNSDTIEAAPSLATDWTADGDTWTFHLRTDVKFQDGSPFNAAAVKAHFDRMLGPEAPVGARDFVPYVKSVDAPDDATVVFTSITPDPDLPLRLAGPTGLIESPTAFAKYGVDDYKNHPVGTGPFTFKEWVADDHVTLDRNDDYWGGEPKLAQVVMRPIAEAGSRLIAAQSGDVQVATSLQPEQLAELKDSPDLTVNEWPTTRHIFIGMHNLKKPFDNPLVRQAMSYAIDWDGISTSLYQGMATPAGGPVPKPEVGSADVHPYSYDPDKAKQLLAQAGYPDGFDSTITATVGAALKDSEMVQAVQQQLAAIGITLKIEQVEYSKYIDLVREDTKTSELVMWIDTWAANTAESVLHDRYYCPSYRPTGVNLTGYCNPAVDTLIESAESDLDADSRQASLDQAQQIVAEDAPSLWGVYVDTAYAAQKNVKGLMRAQDEGVWADMNTTVG